MLIETLGTGGMGKVYMARDTRLNQFVALKLWRKDFASTADQKKQLREEARVAASVGHSNVVQIFSCGIDHGQFYLVMELVDHGSLDELIERHQRLPEAQVLTTGIQIARGLQAAHAKGLLHHDVKPSNILFNAENMAKISDFDLAGVVAQSRGKREIWGTPYYVAPERLNDEPEDLTSDVYSLGASLFHAVAGKAPIEGETNSTVTLIELKNQPLQLAKIVPEVSDATARILHRMMAPHPADRFCSYEELLTELEQAYASLGPTR